MEKPIHLILQSQNKSKYILFSKISDDRINFSNDLLPKIMKCELA